MAQHPDGLAAQFQPVEREQMNITDLEPLQQHRQFTRPPSDLLLLPCETDMHDTRGSTSRGTSLEDGAATLYQIDEPRRKRPLAAYEKPRRKPSPGCCGRPSAAAANLAMVEDVEEMVRQQGVPHKLAKSTRWDGCNVNVQLTWSI